MRITMPQLGESVVEGTIGRWLKREGDPVAKYEPLVEIITDKVNAEYPSPVEGKLKAILVPEGETVEVGAEIAEMEVVGEAAAEPAPVGAQSQSAATAEVAAPPAEPVQATARDESGRRYSPAVRRLAEEHNLDLSMIQGTGAGGRVTKRDVEQFLERRERERPAAEPAMPAPELAPQMVSGPRPSPLAEGDTLVPLTPMRRSIAEHMVRSAYTAPHVTTVVEVDMTRIVRFRERVREEFERREGVPLTYVPFVLRAVVDSLREHPYMNAVWSDEGIVLKRRINIGVAVGFEEGLIVPVIHDADEKSLVGLARAVADLASRARSGRLRPEDVQGGTFTVNNPGTFGTIVSTPIIVQPQAGILSTEAIVKRPVVVDDAIAIRSMMYMSLSFDHRILDGLQAARFLKAVKDRLEAFEPESSGL